MGMLIMLVAHPGDWSDTLEPIKQYIDWHSKISTIKSGMIAPCLHDHVANKRSCLFWL